LAWSGGRRLAEVGELDVDRPGGGRRDEHLPAVADSGDAGRPMHVISNVALVRGKRRARMQADPHLDRPCRERARHRRGRRKSSRSGRKGEEECVSLRIHLDAALGNTGLADNAPVFSECRCVRLGTQFVEQLVDPATSVKRNVTVPPGRSLRIGLIPSECERDGIVEGHCGLPFLAQRLGCSGESISALSTTLRRGGLRKSLKTFDRFHRGAKSMEDTQRTAAGVEPWPMLAVRATTRRNVRGGSRRQRWRHGIPPAQTERNRCHCMRQLWE
jgi:hypothetical protein